MKRILLAACLAGCALGLGAQTVLAESVKVPVNKISSEGVGEAIGFVVFEDDGKGGMDIMVDVVGIPQGDHGMHVHENPSCAPAAKDGVNVAGLSAGGHYDPTHAGKHASFRADYVAWLLEYSGAGQLAPVAGRKPLKIVGDAGNGCAGLVLNDLMAALPFEFVCRQMQPDGTFPDGVPNPLLPERRAATAAAVRESGADMTPRPMLRKPITNTGRRYCP